MDYESTSNLILINPTKLEQDLREALKSYRYPNKATKAILANVEKIKDEYEGNLHNIYTLSVENNLGTPNNVAETLKKISLEVWRRVNDFYWYGSKKAGVFIRELVTQGLWNLSLEDIPIPADSRVRRVLFRLGLVEERNNLKEVEEAARELSKKAKITSLDLDYVLWFVGDEQICGERKALCGRCPLEVFCPKGSR